MHVSICIVTLIGSEVLFCPGQIKLDFEGYSKSFLIMSKTAAAPAPKLFYPGDDEKTNFKRKNRTPQPTKLRKGLTPGSVVIILGGRFKGRRVVFLKQLKSGLLLVTGPYKINGVPLRRINQAYVLPTSTTVPLDGVNAAKIEDDFFARKRVAQPKKTEESKFFQTEAILTEEEKKAIKEKRTNQASFDTALIANIKKVEHLKSYLSKRFSLRSGQYPHLMKF